MDSLETVALVAINLLLSANAVLLLHRVFGPG
jgi:hypothetical protein